MMMSADMVETDATTDATTLLAPSIALATIAVTPSSPVGGAKISTSVRPTMEVALRLVLTGKVPIRVHAEQAFE
jgi:hypothetical protein